MLMPVIVNCNTAFPSYQLLGQRAICHILGQLLKYVQMGYFLIATFPTKKIDLAATKEDYPND